MEGVGQTWESGTRPGPRDPQEAMRATSRTADCTSQKILRFSANATRGTGRVLFSSGGQVMRQKKKTDEG